MYVHVCMVYDGVCVMVCACVCVSRRVMVDDSMRDRQRDQEAQVCGHDGS